MQDKKCSKCGCIYPATVENFYRHNTGAQGLTPSCRHCCNKAQTEWKRKNSIALAKRRRELYATKNGPRVRALEAARFEKKPFQVQAQRLCSSIRDRCKKRGLKNPDWAQTRNILLWLHRQPLCQCCGVSFKIGPKNNGGICDPASPSFDRFDSEKGYEIENVNLICWKCNNIKRNYTAEDLDVVSTWMKGIRT